MLAGAGGRIALAPGFAGEGTRARAWARLLEVDDAGEMHELGSWSFAGSNDGLPPFAFEVVEEAARKLGVTAATPAWQLAFDTSDDIAAMWFLASLGGVSLLEDGFALEPDVATIPLAQLYALAPRMQAGIDLLPDLLVAMVKQLGTSEFELAGVLRGARGMIG